MNLDMYNIISYVLIIISVIVVIFIITRRWADISALEIIKEKKVKEKTKKNLKTNEQVIVDRLEHDVTSSVTKSMTDLSSIFHKIGSVGKLLHSNLHEVKEKHKKLDTFSVKDVDEEKKKFEPIEAGVGKEIYKSLKRDKTNKEEKKLSQTLTSDSYTEEPTTKTVVKQSSSSSTSVKDSLSKKNVTKNEDTQKQIDNLFEEVDSSIDNGDFETSEKKLIEIIELDIKNIDAFRALGEIYFEQKKYGQAIETLKHAIKLGGDEEDCFNLALYYKEFNKIDKALENIQYAIKSDPKNINYLDLLFDISIDRKDTKLAFDTFYKLKKADPNNSEIDELKKKIKEINI